MRKYIVSLSLILMVVVFNCYSPFLTDHGGIVDRLTLEPESGKNLAGYSIDAWQKFFEDHQLIYNRSARKQSDAGIHKDILSINRFVKRHLHGTVGLTKAQPQNNHNQPKIRTVVLMLGLQQRKIIASDDAKHSPLFPII